MFPTDTAYQRNLAMMFAAPSLAIVIALSFAGLAYLVTPTPTMVAPPLALTHTAPVGPIPLSRPPVAPVAAAPDPAAAPDDPSADIVMQAERLAALDSAVKGYPVIRRMVEDAMEDDRLEEAEYQSIDRRLARIKRNQAERNRRRARSRRH